MKRFVSRGLFAKSFVTVPACMHGSHPKYLKGRDLQRLSMVEEVEIKAAESMCDASADHQVWSKADVADVPITHKRCEGIVDTTAYAAVRLMRWAFDTFSGYRFGTISERKVLNRIVFLETVAGVPGMVAGMLRHMRSLRKLQRDQGWIHTLLEEAENERMHLLTFLEVQKPSIMFRAAVLITQGIFFNWFFIMYCISPRFCHRLVGYLEEEAVVTYTAILQHIDDGHLPQFAAAKCPHLAKSYWKLPEEATFRDLILMVRADEAGHRLVNHTFADMHQKHFEHHTHPFVVTDDVTPAKGPPQN